jgi:hypothetical protein
MEHRIFYGICGGILLAWWVLYVTFSLFHFLVVWGRPSNILVMSLEFAGPLAAGGFLLLVSMSGRWDTKTPGSRPNRRAYN